MITFNLFRPESILLSLMTQTQCRKKCKLGKLIYKDPGAPGHQWAGKLGHNGPLSQPPVSALCPRILSDPISISR